ncbi:hypothetical protein ALP75_204488 [Pseudomonas syringae pv. actinidiae]|nr:hypothetical protein ALP75_204488 [Pseudomonas syringae pv. actinidiae]
MTTQQLAGNTVHHAIELEAPFFLGQLRVEDHLKQQVTQLTLQMIKIALLDGIRHFIGFFQRMRHDTGVRLLQIPRAPELRIAQPGHEV